MIAFIVYKREDCVKVLSDVFPPIIYQAQGVKFSVNCGDIYLIVMEVGF